MSTSISKKRGRPASYVHDRNGRPIVGLSLHKSTGRYYASHADPRVYFGKDYDVAVMRFRSWQAEEEDEPLAAVRLSKQPTRIKAPHVLTPQATIEMFSSGMSIDEIVEAKSGTFQLMPPDDLYTWARKEITQDPKKFAERTGIPEIAHLTNVRPPEPSLTLDEVRETFLSGKKQLTSEWAGKIRLHWDEFVDQVRKRTLQEVEASDIQRYHDAVWELARKKKRSSTWLNHRLSTIRTLLRYALKCGRDQSNVRRVLDHTAIFERKRSNGVDPRPIDRDDFCKLLDAADAKWKAAYLLALNACLYPSELAAIKRKEIDLSKGTLITRRGKTGIFRCAVLWKRTIAAIKKYEKEYQQVDSEWLFQSFKGRNHGTLSVRRYFYKHRDLAQLPKSITFDMIRDGAYTAVIEAGHDLQTAQLIAGHATGISDNYVRRNPKMVADACAAIEQAYFG